MQTLPPEIVRHVLRKLDSLDDLVSLSRVSRYLNVQTVPLIYEHTTVDLKPVYVNKDALSRAAGLPPPFLAQLQGMARNTQGQCQFIRRLSIINLDDWKIAERNPPEAANDLLDERNGIQFFINSFLEMAIPRMDQLSEFEWAVLAYPSDDIFRALSMHKLSSFTYHWPGSLVYESQSLTRDYPSHTAFDTRLLNTDNLTSLSMYNIMTDKAADDAADLMFNLRGQLKVLRLGRMKSFLPKFPHSCDAQEQEARDRYISACLEDSLYPLIRHFIVADAPEPMELHELEVTWSANSFKLANWARAFDFHSIQRFTVLHGTFYFGKGLTALWNHLRETSVRFKALTTDCENQALDDFLQSFDGLESLFLCDQVKRWMRVSQLTLAGHFHSLKKLFFPTNVDSGFSWRHNLLRDIIANCRALEELGTYIPQEKDIEPTFELLERLPCLKRVYITSASTLKWGVYYNHEQFLRMFFSYFSPRNSAFLNRLEILSYFRTLWEIVPADLTPSEQEELDYEMGYETLSDRELDTLHAEHTIGEQEHMYKVQVQLEGQKEAGNDAGEDTMDRDPFEYLTEPECYTWYRAFSGSTHLPLRASWADYRDDELAWTVYDYVTVRLGCSSFTATPVKSDMWADWSDDEWYKEESEDEEGNERSG